MRTRDKIIWAILITAAFAAVDSPLGSAHVCIVWAGLLGLLFFGQRLLFPDEEDCPAEEER